MSETKLILARLVEPIAPPGEPFVEILLTEIRDGRPVLTLGQAWLLVRQLRGLLERHEKRSTK